MNSEIILLTKNYQEDELKCWLDWHLNIINVNKITIFDNESEIDIRSLCHAYGDRVSYNYISGWPNQYKLYNDYINTSKSDWILPIDDDEYLYIGKEYSNDCNTFIKSFYSKYHKNKCYIMWLNLFSKEYQKEKSDLFINTHTFYSYEACNNMSTVWKQDNGYGKCFFRNQDGLKYEYRLFGRRWVGHSPKCLNGDDDLLTSNGIKREEDRVVNLNEIVDPSCFIAHYQFKNKRDWEIKCNRTRISTQKLNIRNKVFLYDLLYQYKETFKKCNLLKDIWDAYSKS